MWNMWGDFYIFKLCWKDMRHNWKSWSAEIIDKAVFKIYIKWQEMTDKLSPGGNATRTQQYSLYIYFFWDSKIKSAVVLIYLLYLHQEMADHPNLTTRCSHSIIKLWIRPQALCFTAWPGKYSSMCVLTCMDILT